MVQYHSGRCTVPDDRPHPRQTDASSYDSALLNENAYYDTMISRLHNFDGSMATATAAYYVEYADQNITHVWSPVLTNAEAMNVSAAAARAAQSQPERPAGYHADVPQSLHRSCRSRMFLPCSITVLFMNPQRANSPRIQPM